MLMVLMVHLRNNGRNMPGICSHRASSTTCKNIMSNPRRQRESLARRLGGFMP